MVEVANAVLMRMARGGRRVFLVQARFGMRPQRHQESSPGRWDRVQASRPAALASLERAKNNPARGVVREQTLVLCGWGRDATLELCGLKAGAFGQRVLTVSTNVCKEARTSCN